MAKTKVGKKKILEAITNAHGMKTGICDLLGISRPTLDRYIKNNPDLQEAIEFSRVRWKDRAEYKLHEAIERGDSWAIMFTLKNAHDREYNERIVMTIEKMSDDELAKAIEPYLARIGARIIPPDTKRLDAAPEHADGDGGAV